MMPIPTLASLLEPRQVRAARSAAFTEGAFHHGPPSMARHDGGSALRFGRVTIGPLRPGGIMRPLVLAVALVASVAPAPARADFRLGLTRLDGFERLPPPTHVEVPPAESASGAPK